MSEREATSDSWTPPRDAPRRAGHDAFQVRPSQLTGALIGDRYKIRGYLSRGSISRVYLAEDLETEAPVVIKMLSAGVAKDANLRARVEQAKSSHVPILHANLVDLLGIGETGAGVPYLVMEALAGESLEEMLRRLGQLPVDLSLVVGRQAALGLSALHDAGLVHGDLCPSNIMVLGAPDEPYGVKLLNYGVARRFRNLCESEGPNAPGAEAEPLATPSAFTAPEQILDGIFDPRGDVYALGIVMLVALSGRFPFQGADSSGGYYDKLSRDTLDSFWIDETLDPRLEAVVTNATRRHPENRYPSAAALLEDLDALVGLSNKEVTLVPLSRTPDHYEPRTEQGRRALDRLAEQTRSSLGPSAKTP